MSRGIRRTEPAHPPTGTVIGADVIKAPLDVERGLVRGSSNPANEQSATQPYDDKAEVAKHESPRVNEKSPFEIHGK